MSRQGICMIFLCSSVLGRFLQLYCDIDLLERSMWGKCNDDIAGGHPFCLLTLSKKTQKRDHFDLIRHKNDFDVSSHFLTYSIF